MFEACFYNIKTGEVKRVGTPNDFPPAEDGWVRISHEVCNMIEFAIKFATAK